MKKSIGILIIIGVVLAILGESRPAVANVYGAFGNPELQLEVIKNNATDWNIAQIGLGIGGLISAIGLGLFALEVPRISDNVNVHRASYVGGALVVLGGLAHAIGSYNLVAQSPENIVATVNNGGWTGIVYSVFTQIAILIFGYVLLRSGYSIKMGWVVLVLGVLLIVLFTFGGPPAFNNFVILVVGLSLLFKRSPQVLKEVTE